MLVLTVNVGSSSLKSAVFDVGDASERRIFSASVRQHQDGLIASAGPPDAPPTEETIGRSDGGTTIPWLVARLERDKLAGRLTAVGHRLVHGGARYRGPVWLTGDVLRDLRELTALAPDHLSSELTAVEQICARWPRLPSAAAFDTAFHTTLPDHARLFGLPRRFTDAGVIRFGFHGLSYEYVVSALRATGDLPRRLVVAHLGSGASLAAIFDGQSIDTTMGFTPAGGIVMSTRSGDLDPGVLLYLERTMGLDTEAVNRTVNVDGGLLGISGTTGDMRTLLDRADQDARAATAIDVFCYQVAKAVGALAAALGGLDTLVFTGGIGEHAGVIRQRVCERLAWCGVTVDATRNASPTSTISAADAPVVVRVVATDEELMVARHVRRLLEGGGVNGTR